MEETIGADFRSVALFYFSDSLDKRSKKRRELLFGLLTASLAVAQLQVLFHAQRNATMIPTVVCIGVGCGTFPGDTSKLSSDTKSLPGVEGRLGMDE